MTKTDSLNHEIFADLSPEDRQTILDFARLRKLRRGEMLVRQGEVADTVYYVLRGKFEVLRDGRHLVAEIMAGEPVGEIAFFGGLPRTADVQASRDSDVLELSQQAYAALSARLPAFTQAVLRSLGRRLAAYRRVITHPRQMMSSHAEHQRIIAAISQGEEDVAQAAMRTHVDVIAGSAADIVLALEANAAPLSATR